ncbi:LuxR family transcriptional regulator [Mycolicibacterium sp. 050232]|uniref:LuxR family transcriptional regulator n=1 Tax=Mycolicibacterium sp. 050232 TaxID=3113982 RepID=UPI002E29D2F8|nr:LuxR family transcriptional regulator [Mycolicibacterium sp. 050232]MED5813738.1 LuxR family transcriptional regulator [Mycolicibacterium sp. 050232]
MSGTGPRADTPPVNWSDLGVTDLPTGTVTLLLADVEGSTRLWEVQPEDMTAAFALLDRTLGDLVAIHHGVRPVEQGEGDSFVVAFSRASDAVACALDLQRAPLSPIRMRIGLHTGEIQFRNDANYIGPTINRTARLRDLAHGGQTVLSGATAVLVADVLPADAWLIDLGSHPLRSLPRPEQVAQLCHSDLRTDFPPLRVPGAVVPQRFPQQLTAFIGRQHQIGEVRNLLADNRLVTLTGAGGVGKTRLALQVATDVSDEFGNDAWWADLAPIIEPEEVPVAVARALRLADCPGRSPIESIARFVGDRRMLIVLDNCEHLLDASAEMMTTLQQECAHLVLLTTSREPIGVGGEVTWRVPSLSLTDEAIELFSDRARRARPAFRLTADNTPAVREICRRLDGIPLAIELAAARVRSLSAGEILEGLQDRFRLLTGGTRTAMRRQQTLRASVDWSYALLTEAERALLRRVAVFTSGFDLDGARSVGSGERVPRADVVELLGLLVDKSMVATENDRPATRYRLLEYVRQYAVEKLTESDDADLVRHRHRDFFIERAARLSRKLSRDEFERLLWSTEADIPNYRSALTWSLESDDLEKAFEIVDALSPLWFVHAHITEGLGWTRELLARVSDSCTEVAPLLRVRVLATYAVMKSWVGARNGIVRVEETVTLARELADPQALLAALSARAEIAAHFEKPSSSYFTEAVELARKLGDQRALCQVLVSQAYAATLASDPVAARAFAQEARSAAEAVGDWYCVWRARVWVAWSNTLIGELSAAISELEELCASTDPVHDVARWVSAGGGHAVAMAFAGDVTAAQSLADTVVDIGRELGPLIGGYFGYHASVVALAAGDITKATRLVQTARGLLAVNPGFLASTATVLGGIALAEGDTDEATRWADESVATNKGWQLVYALVLRSRVAEQRGDAARATQDAHLALAVSVEIGVRLLIPDILECLGAGAAAAGNDAESARLFGAAEMARKSIGAARFVIYNGAYENAVATLRNRMCRVDFDAAWSAGAALSVEEAIAYAQRGRGERKRPATGWDSLTPMERDVVRLVSEGLSNKEIAARLFVSPRTVQTHLTHVYAKLQIGSRVQLAREAVRVVSTSL